MNQKKTLMLMDLKFNRLKYRGLMILKNHGSNLKKKM
jgi:hypothetical protein